MSDPIAPIASNLAHLMLIQERNKVGVKKSDINRMIIQGNAEDRASTARLFKDVLHEADRILETTLGFRIKEVPGKSVYILVNQLNFEDIESFLGTDPEWAQIRGLLSTILSLILMVGGEIREDQLWNFLGNLNVASDDKNHPTFGDVEKLVKTTLVKWHYLHFVKEKHGPNTFSWGIRAEHEFNKMEMLNFVASIYGEGRTARDFSEVFSKLEAEQAAAAQAAESFNENSNPEE